jgi:hypothetical protein
MISVDSAMHTLYTVLDTSEYKASSSYTTARSYTPDPMLQPKPHEFSIQAPLLRLEFQVDTLGK